MAGFWGVSRAIEPLDSNGLILIIYKEVLEFLCSIIFTAA